MTAELEEYTRGLEIYAYRMIDGSLVLAEEIKCDEVEEGGDDTLVFARPLQVIRTMTEKAGISSILLPWLLGETDHLHIPIDTILVRTRATLAEKTSYCQYFLINTLKGVMDSAELSELMSDSEAPNAPKPTKKPSASKANDLGPKLKHNKRFDLN